MTPKEYLRAPGSAAATSFHKAQTFPVPPDVHVVHARDWHDQHPDPERYFKLTHDLLQVLPVALDRRWTLEALDPDRDAQAISDIVANSYENERLPLSQIAAMRESVTFDPACWIGAYDTMDGSLVGCVLAEHDGEIGEISLEWLQVLPSRRGHGLASALVQELVRRTQPVARVMTVSGRVDNDTRPEAVYRRNGFVGDDIWYVWRD